MAASGCWPGLARNATQGIWCSHPHAHRTGMHCSHARPNQIPCPPMLAPQALPLHSHEQSKLQRPRPFIVDPPTHQPVHPDSRGSANSSMDSCDNPQDKAADDEPSLAAPVSATSGAQQDEEQRHQRRQRRFRRRARQLRRQEVLHLGPLDAAAAALMSGETDPSTIVPLLAAASRSTCAAPASQLLQGHVELMGACAKLGMRLPGSVMLPWGAILEPLLSPGSQQQGQATALAPPPPAPPVAAQQQLQQQQQQRLRQDGQAQHPQALWMATLQRQQQQHPGPSLPYQQPLPEDNGLSVHSPPPQASPPPHHALLWPPITAITPPPPHTSVQVRHSLAAPAMDPHSPHTPTIPPPDPLPHPPLSTHFRNPPSPRTPATPPFWAPPSPLPHPSLQPLPPPRCLARVPLPSTGVGAAAWRADCALRLLEACSSLGHHLGHPTMEALMAWLDPCWPALLPHQLVTCLRALAHLNYFPQQPPCWLQGVLKAMTAQLSHYNASQVCAVLRSLAQLDTNEWANPRHVSAQAELVRALAARRELHTEIIDLLPPINLHALHPSVKPKQQSRSPGVRVGNKEVAPNSLQPGLHASGASLSRAKSDEASSPAPPASSTTTATSSTRSRSAAPVPLRRRMMLLPASGTRVRPLQRRMQERDVRLGLWLLTHLQVPVSRQWLWALLAGAARRSRVLSPAALVATFQVMAVYRWLPPFAARHRLWLWVRRRWRSLGSYHASMLLTWALKAGTQPSPTLVAAAVAAVERSGVKSQRAHAAGRWSRHFGDCKRVRDVARVLWVAWQCSSRQRQQQQQQQQHALPSEGQIQALCAALAQGVLDSVPWRPSKALTAASQPNRDHPHQQQQQQQRLQGAVVAMPCSELALALWSLAMYAAAPTSNHGSSSSSVSSHGTQLRHALPLSDGRRMLQEALGFALPRMLQQGGGACRAGDAARIVCAAQLLRLQLPPPLLALLLSRACAGASAQAHEVVAGQQQQQQQHKVLSPQQQRPLHSQQQVLHSKQLQLQQQQQQQVPSPQQQQQQQQQLRPAELLLLLQSIAHLPEDMLATVLRGVPSAQQPSLAAASSTPQPQAAAGLPPQAHVAAPSRCLEAAAPATSSAPTIAASAVFAATPQNSAAASAAPATTSGYKAAAPAARAASIDASAAAEPATSAAATQSSAPAGDSAAPVAAQLRTAHHMPERGGSVDRASALPMRAVGNSAVPFFQQRCPPHQQLLAPPPEAHWEKEQLVQPWQQGPPQGAQAQQQQQRCGRELPGSCQHQQHATPQGSNCALDTSAPCGPTPSIDALHSDRSSSVEDACLLESAPGSNSRKNSGSSSSSSSSNQYSRSTVSKQGRFTERGASQSTRPSGQADATAERWASISRALPSLAALCEALPPRALAAAAGDVLFVEGLAALSRLKLRMGQGWLQACAAEVSLMLSIRGPLPPASLVHLLHATASLPLCVAPQLLESVLPGLLAPPPLLAPASAANSSSSSSRSTTRKSTSSSRSRRHGLGAHMGSSGTGSSRQASSSGHGLKSKRSLTCRQPQGSDSKAKQPLAAPLPLSTAPQQKQQEWDMAVSATDVVAVLWLCSQLRLRVPSTLLLVMRSTIHAHLPDLSAGNLARAVLGLVEVQSTHNCDGALGCSSSGDAAMQSGAPGPMSTQEQQQEVVGAAQFSGAVGETKGAPMGGQQLEERSRALQDGIMLRLVESMPIDALSQAAQPGYAWGSRAKASGVGEHMHGSSSSSSSNRGGGWVGNDDGGGEGRWDQASITSTLCAMTPDQLCSVLLGLAKWQQQQQQQHQQQQQQQQQQRQQRQHTCQLKEEWLGALLGLVQARTRGVISSRGLLRCTSALLLLQHTPSMDLLRTLKRRTWNLRKSKLISADDLQLFGHQHQLLQQLASRPRGGANSVTAAGAEAVPNPQPGAQVLDQRAAGTGEETGVVVKPVAHHRSQLQQQQQHVHSSRQSNHRHALFATAAQLLRRLPLLQSQPQPQQRQQQEPHLLPKGRPGGLQPSLGSPQLSAAPSQQPQPNNLLPISTPGEPQPALHPQQHAWGPGPPHSVYLQRLQQAFHALALRMLLGVEGSRRGRADAAVANNNEVREGGNRLLLLGAPPQLPREELGEGSSCLGFARAQSLESNLGHGPVCHVQQMGHAKVLRAPFPVPSVPCLPASTVTASSSSSSSSSSGSGNHIDRSHIGRDRKSGFLRVDEYVGGRSPQIGRPVHLLEFMLRLKFQYTINTAAQKRRKLRLQ